MKKFFPYLMLLFSLLFMGCPYGSDVAIDDGGVACLEGGRDLVPSFDTGQIVNVFCLQGKTVLRHIRNPTATAASGGCLKNGQHRGDGGGGVRLT